MKSKMAQILKLKYNPVAIIFSNEKPDEAIQFDEGKWGCVITMLTNATKGQRVVFDRKTYGCKGGGVGLGFGNTYEGFPGGIEYFLSTGRGEGYLEGEGFKKTPQLAKDFIEQLLMIDIPYKYVIFQPLHLLGELPQLFP